MRVADSTRAATAAQVCKLEEAMHETQMGNREKQHQLERLEEQLSLAERELDWERRFKENFDQSEQVSENAHCSSALSKTDKDAHTDSELEVLLSDVNKHIQKAQSAARLPACSPGDKLQQALQGSDVSASEYSYSDRSPGPGAGSPSPMGGDLKQEKYGCSLESRRNAPVLTNSRTFHAEARGGGGAARLGSYFPRVYSFNFELE